MNSPLLRICLNLLFLVLLVSCQEEPQDQDFRIGTFDQLDFHLSFPNPINLNQLESFGFDLDQDGGKDVRIKWIKDQQASYSISSVYVERQPNSSAFWEIATTNFIDSLFICEDKGSGQPGLIYNRSSGYQCSSSIDSLLNVQSLTEMARSLEKEDAIDSISRWDELASIYRYEESYPPNPRHIFYQFNTTSEDRYIALKRVYQGQNQRAWIKIRLVRNASDPADVNLQVLEYAVQAYARD